LSAGVLSDKRGEKVSSGEIIVANPDSDKAENDETFFQTKYAAYADERKWYNTKAHYGELWWSDKVFYSALNPDPQVAKCPKKVAPPVEEQILMRMAADIAPAVTATSEQLIPRIIMQTNESYDVPKKMYDAMMTVSFKNPDYQYIYFDSERRKQYITDNFGSEMLEVYDTLIPGAFKADLFRYCFLFKTGGVYVDSGMVAKLSLSSLIKPDDQFLAPEDDGGKRVCNGFMCVAPNHPILQLTIDRVVENVRSHYYGQSSLQITGPILMGDVFFKVVKRKAEAETDYGNGVRLISHLSARTISGDVCVSPGEIRAGGQLFFMTKYPLYHLDMLWYHTKEHYDTLWNIRQIYNN
jgi:mannosyltransferase OCH1-like enzyme